MTSDSHTHTRLIRSAPAPLAASQSFLFACLCGAHMLVLRIIQELWQASGGVFNVDEVCDWRCRSSAALSPYTGRPVGHPTDRHGCMYAVQVLQQIVCGLEDELEMRSARPYQATSTLPSSSEALALSCDAIAPRQHLMTLRCAHEPYSLALCDASLLLLLLLLLLWNLRWPQGHGVHTQLPTRPMTCTGTQTTRSVAIPLRGARVEHVPCTGKGLVLLPNMET